MNGLDNGREDDGRAQSARFSTNGHGQHPPAPDIEDELSRLPEGEIQPATEQRSKAMWGEDPRAVRRLSEAKQQQLYLEKRIAFREADLWQWLDRLKRTQLTKRVATKSLAFRRDDVFKWVALGLYSLLALSLGAAELCSGSQLVLGSPSSFADSVWTALAIAMSVVGAPLALAQYLFGASNPENQKLATERLTRHAPLLIGGAFLTFGLAFGNAHAPVDALTNQVGVIQSALYKGLAVVSLLLLCLGLYCTKFLIVGAYHDLRAMRELVNPSYVLVLREVERRWNSLRALSEVLGNCKATIAREEQAMARIQSSLTVGASVKREQRRQAGVVLGNELQEMIDHHKRAYQQKLADL